MDDQEKINLKIEGITSENTDVPIDKYSSFEEMVKDYLNKTKGVLTKIKINEKEVPLSYYDEIKDAFFEGGESVELEFTSKKKVLLDLITQSREYIKKVRENLEEISKEILLNSNEGHKMLNSIAEGMQALLDVVEQTRVFTEEDFYDHDELNQVQVVIKDIVNAQNQQDYLELSDIFEVDFENVLVNFEKILNDAQKTLENQGV